MVLAIHSWQDSASYEGQWVNDVSEGKEVYSTADGLIYKSEWKNNKCKGRGAEEIK